MSRPTNMKPCCLILSICFMSGMGCASLPIPVNPYLQDQEELDYHNYKRYERVPILGPTTAGGPSIALDPPSDDEVMQALERARPVRGGIQSGSGLVIVFLRDENEFAPVAPPPQTVTLAEISVAGTVVATIRATDPDRNQTVSYAIAAGNATGTFAIDAKTGAVTVANPAALDYENQPPFELTVAAAVLFVDHPIVCPVMTFPC